jgi:hypothetical protein
MKSLKQKIVSVGVCILIVFMGMILFPTNSFAEDPETILEGEITIDGFPAQNIDVVITNLDTGAKETVQTNENGYYSFKFEDHNWEINKDTAVETLIEDPDREDPYFDKSIRVETPEEDKTYKGNFEVEDTDSFTFPEDTSGLTGTPYLGYVYVSKDAQGGTTTTYTQGTSVDFVARATVIDEKYTATFDTRYKDPRDLSEELYRERWYIMTKKDGSTSSSSDCDQWESFNPPHDTGVEDNGVEHCLAGSTTNSWIRCYSEGGYNVEYWVTTIPEWTYGAGGYGGTTHYVWLP